MEEKQNEGIKKEEKKQKDTNNPENQQEKQQDFYKQHQQLKPEVVEEDIKAISSSQLEGCKPCQEISPENKKSSSKKIKNFNIEEKKLGQKSSYHGNNFNQGYLSSLEFEPRDNLNLDRWTFLTFFVLLFLFLLGLIILIFYPLKPMVVSILTQQTNCTLEKFERFPCEQNHILKVSMVTNLSLDSHQQGPNEERCINGECMRAKVKYFNKEEEQDEEANLVPTDLTRGECFAKISGETPPCYSEKYKKKIFLKKTSLNPSIIKSFEAKETTTQNKEEKCTFSCYYHKEAKKNELNKTTKSTKVKLENNFKNTKEFELKTVGLKRRFNFWQLLLFISVYFLLFLFISCVICWTRLCSRDARKKREGYENI